MSLVKQTYFNSSSMESPAGGRWCALMVMVMRTQKSLKQGDFIRKKTRLKQQFCNVYRKKKLSNIFFPEIVATFSLGQHWGVVSAAIATPIADSPFTTHVQQQHASKTSTLT